MKIKKDGKGQPYVAWRQARGGYKRAWIQRRGGTRDWAHAPGGRYLNIVRTKVLGGPPRGNATDFPIFSDLSDDALLLAFVGSACALTGCPLK